MEANLQKDYENEQREEVPQLAVCAMAEHEKSCGKSESALGVSVGREWRGGYTQVDRERILEYVNWHTRELRQEYAEYLREEREEAEKMERKESL